MYVDLKKIRAQFPKFVKIHILNKMSRNKQDKIDSNSTVLTIRDVISEFVVCYFPKTL